MMEEGLMMRDEMGEGGGGWVIEDGLEMRFERGGEGWGK